CSAIGPRFQASAIDSIDPCTSNTRPVTPLDSGLASQVASTAIQRGDIFSLRVGSSAAAPMRLEVRRVMAPGAMQLTVTPYRTSSIAAMIENAAMPALAAP